VIDPKSDDSRRRVPVVRPYLTDLLVEHKARTGRDGDDLVFGRTTTAVFSDLHHRVPELVDAPNREREANGLEPIGRIGLHDCRHTFGALCRRAGVREDDIKDYLGHAREGVTARYTSSIEYEAVGADNAKLLTGFLARGDSVARIEQVEAGEAAREVVAASPTTGRGSPGSSRSCGWRLIGRRNDDARADQPAESSEWRGAIYERGGGLRDFSAKSDKRMGRGLVQEGCGV
jgi:hypothetical protein